MLLSRDEEALMALVEQHHSAEISSGRNDGTPLELGWFRHVQVNLSAAQRRAATLLTRRSVKKEWHAARLPHPPPPTAPPPLPRPPPPRPAPPPPPHAPPP